MKTRRNILLALNWYDPKIHAGVAAFAQKNNWHLSAPMAKQTSLIPYNWKGDGIICQGHFATTEQTLFFESLPQSRVVLTPKADLFPPDQVTVAVDHSGISDKALEHLLERNFKSFACYWPWKRNVGPRVGRFIKQVKNTGYPFRLLSHDGEDWRERYDWLLKELLKLPVPTAFYCQNDELGAEIIEACMDAGIDVPHHIAVVGVGNDKLVCETLNVSLSSVDSNLFGLGYKAAEMLEKVLDGEQLDKYHYIVPAGDVVVRKSTDIIAVDSGNEKLVRAIQFIRDNFHDPDFGTIEVAEGAAMSQRTLYELFEKHVGRTPHSEIRRLRLEEAERLLKETDLPPQEVAERSGYSTLRNFYNTFKNSLQTTPVKFRAANRKRR